MRNVVIYRAKKLHSNEYATGTVLEEPRGNWTMYWLENSSDAVTGLEGKYMNCADIDPNTIEIVGPLTKPTKDFPPANSVAVGKTLSSAYIYRCEECGYLLKKDYTFCPKCGRRIDWGVLNA